MSEAATVFWSSVIRHVLSTAGGVLVTHGYVSQVGATKYSEELVGLALTGGALAWSQRAHYWELVKRVIALRLPPGSTDAQVTDRIASLKAIGAPMPSLAPLGTNIPPPPIAKPGGAL